MLTCAPPPLRRRHTCTKGSQRHGGCKLDARCSCSASAPGANGPRWAYCGGAVEVPVPGTALFHRHFIKSMIMVAGGATAPHPHPHQCLLSYAEVRRTFDDVVTGQALCWWLAGRPHQFLRHVGPAEAHWRAAGRAFATLQRPQRPPGPHNLCQGPERRRDGADDIWRSSWISHPRRLA